MFFLVLHPVSKPFRHHFDQFIDLIHKPRLQITQLSIHPRDISLDLVQTTPNNQLGFFKSSHPVSQVSPMHGSTIMPTAVVVVLAVLDTTVE